MSNNEQQAESAAAATTQQQRRSRRLEVVKSSNSSGGSGGGGGGGGGGMTNTSRPKQQQTSATTTNVQSGSDNNNNEQNNTLASTNNNNNNNTSNNASNLIEPTAATSSTTTSTSPTSSTPTTTAAAAATLPLTTSSSTSAPSTPSTAATMQAKTRGKFVRRTTEPKEEDIRLVRMVKLYPFLYDRTDLSYGKKKSSETTWEIISQAMSQPVPTCKDRWRNIRAAYMRSIDCYKTQNGPNRSKEYYLKHELTFLRECAEKQKAKGIVSVHDSSSNDADSDLGTSSSLISVIDNTQNMNEANEMEPMQQQQHQQQQTQTKIQIQQQPTQNAHPRLVPRPTAQLIETPTTSQSQQQYQLPTFEPSTRVTISAAPASSNCNGYQTSMLTRHANTVPIPIQLPIQFPLQLPLAAATSCNSSNNNNATTNANNNAFQRTKFLTLTEQPHERADTSSMHTTGGGGGCSGSNIVAAADTSNPAKRRRYYEYDEKNDIFKRVQFLNIFDKWSEDDSDALFVKSLYLKMRNLNEDQSLRFQCLALNALREVQNNSGANDGTPKTACNNSTNSNTTPNILTSPNANSTLRLDHLNEDQRMQIQQFAQQVAASNDAASHTTTTQRPALHSMMNGYSENSTPNGTLTLRRADLSNIVMPLLIKNEPFDSGHMSN